MSTLNVNNINKAGGVDAIVTDGVAVSVPSGNLVYNGAMQVAQRGTSETSITGVGYYTADRWRFVPANLGTWTQTVEADGPTGSGFTKSLKVECTTADAAPAAGDLVLLAQRLEGQDLQSLKKGTSEAESLTISFWVKSDTTGTYIFELSDVDNTRRISTAYIISAADTWEKKTITIAGDTTGAFDNDNGLSLDVVFWLGAGSNYTSGTLNTSWSASPASGDRAAGQTNLAAATSNYWQVTGVQLEAGTVATSFEHKPYGVELAKCQRYFYAFGGTSFGPLGIAATDSTTGGRTYIPLPVEMRVPPTGITRTGSAPLSSPGSITSLTFDRSTTTALMLTATGTGFTAGGASAIYGNSDGSTILQVTGAEL